MVSKVENPTDDEISALRKRIEAEIHRLYYLHLPKWESRPLNIVRGETSAAASATAAAVEPEGG